MHRAPTLLGVVLTAIPAFASDPTSVREYAERCANYYARQYGVPPALVRAVIQVESAWQPGVVSAKGAVDEAATTRTRVSKDRMAHAFGGSVTI